MATGAVPAARIRSLGAGDVGASGGYVLYWMTAQRRLGYNFAMQRACDWARELRLPLVVLEPLNVDYRWACDRFHAFVIEGMRDHQRAASGLPFTYLPYVEPNPKAGDGLFATLAGSAAVVIADDYPCYFMPALLRVARRHVPVRFEAVDSNGLMPLSLSEKAFLRAFDFRRFLQKNLRPHLDEVPLTAPWAGLEKLKKWQPDRSLDRWEFLSESQDIDALLARLPIDHEVGRVATPGGPRAAEDRLEQFLDHGLERYADDRNNASLEGTSGLSSYLHFGHLSTHEILERIAESKDWSPARVSQKTSGSSEGWWNVDRSTDSFLDELVTWRELGFHFCQHRRDYSRFDSLPDWALDTMAKHESDRRAYLYSLEQFDKSETHDELWNAAQRQLVREGRIHNYLRMLWGKKILEWTPNGREALAVMIELNNRYALDGRDPNSYSGIFWVLGRFDRAWGPEREIFGTLRYMSSDNTRRKMPVRPYLEKYARTPSAGQLF
ncbi:MAG: deoxyribodipyrimidine photolyase [Planctomycetales bacterium]|nr:deoxyribodipyrimidine photolyase [Planctomycetales bacterium]